MFDQFLHLGSDTAISPSKTTAPVSQNETQSNSRDAPQSQELPVDGTGMMATTNSAP